MGNFAGLQLCETCEKTMIDAGVLGLIFEETIKHKAELNFGQAIEALKDGEKVKRASWGGYWFIPNHGPLRGWEPNSDIRVSMNNTIVAKLKDDGGYAPAQAYQADMLAEDWEVVE